MIYLLLVPGLLLLVIGIVFVRQWATYYSRAWVLPFGCTSILIGVLLCIIHIIISVHEYTREQQRLEAICRSYGGYYGKEVCYVNGEEVEL